STSSASRRPTSARSSAGRAAPSARCGRWSRPPPRARRPARCWRSSTPTTSTAKHPRIMERLEVGYVARAHGLGGEVRVHLHATGSTTLFDVERVWIGGREHAVEGARATNGGILLSLADVEDRDAAEAPPRPPLQAQRPPL